MGWWEAVVMNMVWGEVSLNRQWFLKTQWPGLQSQCDILRKKTKLDRELMSEQATAVGPLKATLLTVKLNFIVFVTRHTEQAGIQSAEGLVGQKASAGATRSFHGQQEPVAGCRAVHVNVSRAAQFLSYKVAKPFLGRSKSQSVR